MRCLVAVGLVLATAFSVAACGGGGSSSGGSAAARTTNHGSGELTKAEFIELGDKVCEESKEAGKSFEDKAEELGQEGNTPKVHIELAMTFAEALPLAEEYVDKFAELQPPAEDQSLIDTYVEERREFIEVDEKIIPVLEEGDESELEELANEAERMKLQSQGLAQGYGFKVCGEEAG